MARAATTTARKKKDPMLLVPFTENWMEYVVNAVGKSPARRTAHEIEAIKLSDISAGFGTPYAFTRSTHALVIERDDFEVLGAEDHEAIGRRLAEDLPTVKLAEISLYNGHAYAYVQVADKDWNIETKSKAQNLLEEEIIEIRHRQQYPAGPR